NPPRAVRTVKVWGRSPMEAWRSKRLSSPFGGSESMTTRPLAMPVGAPMRAGRSNWISMPLRSVVAEWKPLAMSGHLPLRSRLPSGALGSGMAQGKTGTPRVAHQRAGPIEFVTSRVLLLAPPASFHWCGGFFVRSMATLPRARAWGKFLAIREAREASPPIFGRYGASMEVSAAMGGPSSRASQRWEDPPIDFSASFRAKVEPWEEVEAWRPPLYIQNIY